MLEGKRVRGVWGRGDGYFLLGGSILAFEFKFSYIFFKNIVLF